MEKVIVRRFAYGQQIRVVEPTSALYDASGVVLDFLPGPRQGEGQYGVKIEIEPLSERIFYFLETEIEPSADTDLH